MNLKLCQFADMKIKKLVEVRPYKSELLKEKTLRYGNDNTVDNLLCKKLEEHNTIKQHFHGDDMNGVCSRRLLDNIDHIF